MAEKSLFLFVRLQKVALERCVIILLMLFAEKGNLKVCVLSGFHREEI